MTVLVRLGVVLAAAGLGMTAYLLRIHSEYLAGAVAVTAFGVVQAVIAYRMRE